jgi:hypothetical protein
MAQESGSPRAFGGVVLPGEVGIHRTAARDVGKAARMLSLAARDRTRCYLGRYLVKVGGKALPIRDKGETGKPRVPVQYTV